MSKEIPENLQPHFGLLDNELSWLNLRWNYYQQLYHGGPSRIELLNAVSSTFFEHLRRIMIDNIIISICRLMDPATTCGNENVTYKTMHQELIEKGYDALADEYGAKITHIESLIEPFRVHRNKRIAHFDLDASLSVETTQLPDISKEMIANVLEEFSQLMNVIHIGITKSQMIYDMIVSHYDAEVMIEVLKQGMFFGEIQRESPMEWFPRYDESKWGKA